MSEPLSAGAVSGEVDRLAAEVVAEITDRLHAGEAVDVEEYVARHPELADRLRPLVAALDLLARFSSSAGPDRPPTRAGAGEELVGTLGDFRLLRELGRGGMGVVYEAEQVSLGRRVALKVLPLAATLGGTQLQRFHNEARAAAGLHHTNIVPVYFVGCERGVHFYAMQFIDGRSLADVLARLRQGTDPAAAPPPAGTATGEASTRPAALLSTAGAARGRDYFQAVADLGVQAAEALDHGHRVGVVHRDVKPGNLLLDDSGRLWVTDFGLAHVQGTESLTAPGELVGTLRYMSPEQALGQRVVIDHRTDVYSLGATLYELLTLRPAFEGADRQELLRQIASEEPVPPRRRNGAVPAELETVVLKALEKNPADRYGTAQELADDLRRWLDDRPIRARRPSWPQVALRWARRRRPLVAAVGAVVLMAAVLGGGGCLWWAQKRAGAEGEARAALREALGLLAEERWPEALSAARRAKGVLSGVGADPLLWQEVEQLGKDLEMARRLQAAHLEMTAQRADTFDREACCEAYAKAFQWYGLDVEHGSPRAVGEGIRSRPIRAQLAAALDNWAFLRRQLGQGGSGKLLEVSRVADPDPFRDRLRDALEGKGSQTLEGLAASVPGEELPPGSAVFFARLAAGTRAAERGLAVLRRTRQGHASDFWVNYELGNGLAQRRRSDLEEGIRYLTAAEALQPQSPGAHLALGFALQARGQLEEATAHYRKAVHLQPDCAKAHSNLGGALVERGQLDEGLAECREAVRLRKDSPAARNNLGAALLRAGHLDDGVAQYREALRLQPDAPLPHRNLGLALVESGRPAEAIAEFREAVRLKPDFPETHNDLGVSLQEQGRLDEAVAAYRKAIDADRDYPEAHYNLGSALNDQGRPNEAAAEFREAIRLKKDHALAHHGLGVILLQQGQFRRAAEEFRLSHELAARSPHAPDPSAPWVRQAERFADLEPRLPALLKGQEQPKDAGERLGLAQLCQLHKRLFAAAARWYGEAFAAQPTLADDLASGNRYNAACAAALAGTGQGKDADGAKDQERARLRRQALCWLRADLDAWRRLLDKGPAQNGPAVAQQLQHWLGDTDFAGVRGPAALGRLPEGERGDWRKLWQEVEALRQRAAGPPERAGGARP